MAASLTPTLRLEYFRLFRACAVRPERVSQVDAFCGKMLAGKTRARYTALLRKEGWALPWYVLGLVHGLECNFSFGRHLHNGDPLSARTVRVPAGRPVGGKPPYTWEESASDALRRRKLDRVRDWSLTNTLWVLESYNGLGYRLYHHSKTLSPYLWSFSNQYTRGKYVADGKFSATAVSNQVGAATALRHLVNLGHVVLP